MATTARRSSNIKTIAEHSFESGPDKRVEKEILQESKQNFAQASRNTISMSNLVRQRDHELTELRTMLAEPEDEVNEFRKQLNDIEHQCKEQVESEDRLRKLESAMFSEICKLREQLAERNLQSKIIWRELQPTIKVLLASRNIVIDNGKIEDVVNMKRNATEGRVNTPEISRALLKEAINTVILITNDHNGKKESDVVKMAKINKVELSKAGRVEMLSMPKALSLHSSIGDIKSLKTLALSHSDILSLPPSIGRAINLKIIDLSRTKRLLNLPCEFGDLANLETLDLEGSNIGSLPSSFGKLRSLAILDLSSTKNLSTLPQEFGDLANLQTLDLEGSNITFLPSSFGKLTNLQILDLEGSNISSLPSSFGKLISLVSLHLSSTRNLSTMPQEFGELANLMLLDLDKSNINSLPSSFGKLISLVTLKLSSTKNLSTLPRDFGKLANLEVLFLGGSNITSLPASVKNLNELKLLDLSDTESLMGLPEEIGELDQLEIIGLESSGIASLPESFEKLKNLKFLGVGQPLLDHAQKKSDFLLWLQQKFPLLGHVDFKAEGVFEEEAIKKLDHALACNRARARTRFSIGIKKKSTQIPISKLSPHILHNAARAFEDYNYDLDMNTRIAEMFGIEYDSDFDSDDNSDGDSDEDGKDVYCIEKADAIYRLLNDRRGSFFQLLLERSENLIPAKKA